MTSTDANKLLVRRFFEEIDNGHLDIVDELVSEDYVDHNPPPVPGIPAGREGLKQALTTVLPGMSGRHHIEDQIAEGDKVVTRMTNYGRHTGDLPGAPRTDRELKHGSIVIHRIADGKIVEKWAERDMLRLFQQLGVFAGKRDRAAAV
jgi:predicted ester cyclase